MTWYQRHKVTILVALSFFILVVGIVGSVQLDDRSHDRSVANCLQLKARAINSAPRNDAVQRGFQTINHFIEQAAKARAAQAAADTDAAARISAHAALQYERDAAILTTVVQEIEEANKLDPPTCNNIP